MKYGTFPRGEMMAFAYFGAGCFWGVEVCFRKINGVIDVTTGYMGGCVPNPTYPEVCSDRTGHAEVVQVQFDPGIVRYDRLLDVFWSCHDPTTINCQGSDTGTQYRSIIFCSTPEQERIAKEKRDFLDKSGRFAKPVVTHIMPMCEFFPAEEYHQRYFEKNPGKQGCRFGHEELRKNRLFEKSEHEA
ncbi:MAG: peptide-methionine (S)-S-oxide reductase MsrA [Planctomycetaceae bacterium]|nr:peptide-methionine (S)-S-oxide reductase MsrA [Planctomycetaceae bacterium]